MIWFWGVLCALALVALFFPFVFWIDFTAGLEGVNVHIRLFKKDLYTYSKTFKNKQSSEKEVASVDEEETEATASAPAPEVEKAEIPNSEEKVESVKPSEPEKKDEPKPVEKQESSKTEETKSSEEKNSDEEEAEKRSLTDQEFWTLLLTPEFDTRAWWAVRHALSALFRLFRIRFIDCFVEGIRLQEYENMGYAAALNGFLKSFPYIGAWDFRMDWTRDHELKMDGHMRASVNLCRTLGLILAILFYGGIVAFTFWRRRARILKTGELPELGFVRNKIVKMMSEDD
ncbi:MAG: hypothetical protein IJ905_08830 [Fibrobacter sp.]|nr:hypothetical protein [Fibrobacter sp.]